MSLAKDLDPLTVEPLWVTIPDEENWWSDEPQLETPLHMEQIVLLLTSLQWWWRSRSRVFISGNISIYYEKRQGRRGSHRAQGPDFFVVKDVPERERKSWMVWKGNNRFPDLIVEILSDSTARVDKTDKKRLYQDTFKTPEYFWFHPWTLEFAGFKLAGGRYQQLVANEQGWLWSEELQLFLGIDNRKLRFFTPAGERVPIPAEAATDEEERRQLAEARAILAAQQRQLMAQQAEQERQQREQAELTAEQAELIAQRERQQREQAELTAQQERQQREQAELTAQQERQQREQAELTAQQERQQREQAQQKMTELEAELAQYRQRFGLNFGQNEKMGNI